jgi:hypothetical protein
MTHMNKYLTGAALAGALTLTGLALTGSTTASAEPPAKPGSQCFYSTEWQGWKATDDHTMYIRVGMRRIFRLDFASSCHTMTWPGVHLVTVYRGGDTVCSPLDLDLRVSDGNGIAEPCIVSGLSELSPDQIAAIPKKDLP